MAVVVPSGFQVTSQEPIDSRITVVDQTARLALNEFNVYPGLIVYQQSTQELYVLNDTGSVNSNTGWSIISGSAGGSQYTAEFSLGASGTNDYVFSGDGFPVPTSDPTLFLIRGLNYKFANDNSAGQHPFQIQTNAPSGGSGTPYNSGVTNNGAAGGAILTWNIPFDAPNLLYYQCTSHPNMSGSIYILNTGSAGSTVNTGSLLTTGSVSSNTLTFTKGDGSTFALTVDTGSGGSTINTGSLLTTASVAGTTMTFEKGDGSTFNVTLPGGSGGSGIFVQTGSYYATTNNLQITGSLSVTPGTTNELTASYAITASHALEAVVEITKEISSSYAESASLAESASFVPFDGNRVVTNQDQPTGIRNVNFGANGLTDFIEKVYFANTAPTITSTDYRNLQEFTPSGSLVGAISTTDPEGQTVTVQTQSSYTLDQFRITGNSIYLNVEASESLNTDSSQGYNSAALPVRATDTLGLFTDKTLYIETLPNTAPVWREVSAAGNVITSETSSLTENSSAGVKSTTYVTDAQSDTITINTGSLTTAFDNAFTLTINSNNVVLTQITSSLDYDTNPTYNFVLTASDEHYPSQDPEAITYLPYEIRVGDNQPPNISNQILNSPNGINENENVSNSLGLFNSYYRNAGQVSVTNPNGTTTIFVSATLNTLSVGGVNVTLGTYSGTSQSDPTEDAFEMNSTGYFRRKAGVFLNSDLIDTYVYTVSVRDTFDPTIVSADVTIQVKDDVAPAINDNWSAGPYINESSLSSSIVSTNANGVSTPQAQFSTTYSEQNETVSWQLNPASPFVLDGSQRISANADISASYFSPSTIAFSVTASNTFGTENKQLYSVTVADNQAPTISARTPISLNAPQNAGTNMCNITISDIEDNTPYNLTLTGADAASLVAFPTNAISSSYEIRLAGTEAAGKTFNYNEVVLDNYGSTQTYARTLTLGAAPVNEEIFVYDVGLGTGNINNDLGIASNNAGTTPQTSTASTGFGFLEQLQANLGSNFTYNYGGTRNGNVLASGSGANVHTIIRSLGSSGTITRAGSNRVSILIPSGSELTGVPTEMTDAYNPSAASNVYVLEIGTDGTTIDGINTIENSNIYQFSVSPSVNGYSQWYMVTNVNLVASTANINMGLNPANGSGGV